MTSTYIGLCTRFQAVLHTLQYKWWDTRFLAGARGSCTEDSIGPHGSYRKPPCTVQILSIQRTLTLTPVRLSHVHQALALLSIRLSPLVGCQQLPPLCAAATRKSCVRLRPFWVFLAFVRAIVERAIWVEGLHPAARPIAHLVECFILFTRRRRCIPATNGVGD